MKKGLGVRGRGLAVVAVVAMMALTASSRAQPAAKGKADLGHDFVFLAEARPLLIRVHVRIDGKTLPAAQDDFMAHLFRYLKTRKGKPNAGEEPYLTKEEVERAPLFSHITAGGLSSPYGGGFGMGGNESPIRMEDFDTDKDGKVTLAELAAYYRKKGFAPFQLHTEKESANSGMMMALGGMGGATEPSVEQVSEAIFNLLDAKKTGKLTKADLAAAPQKLLRLDMNEDEMVTIRELAQPTPGKYDRAAAMDGMFSGAMKGAGPPAKPQYVYMVGAGETAKEMVVRMLEVYTRKNLLPTATLTRKQIGLDEATFNTLDTDGDGFLNAKELAAFANRAPDLDLMMRLGSPGDTQRGVQLLNPKVALADKLRTVDGIAMLDLFTTRVELRGQDVMPKDQFGQFSRLQWTVIFKQADKDGDGYLDEKEAGAGGPFGNIFAAAFKAMDRNGDGKVSEQEFNNYLDFLADMKERTQKACVSLVLSDESRGLFDLLDVNRDGRLSVREMRGAVTLLERFDREKKGYLTRADIPKSYRLSVRRGPAGTTSDDFAALLAGIYGGGGKVESYQEPTAGPLWFRKMDTNRDGDVSRREWLGSDEMFRQIDTDGDGLISAAEADRFDRLHRKGE